MARSNSQIRHKHFRLDSIKLLRAKKLLRADTETETIERALDFVLSEHLRNQLASEANQRFIKSGSEIEDVDGGLDSEIAIRFQEAGFETDISELRGHKIRPASFVRRK
jgi:hypothetical protein